jgi:hypothetical protein
LKRAMLIFNARFRRVERGHVYELNSGRSLRAIPLSFSHFSDAPAQNRESQIHILCAVGSGLFPHDFPSRNRLAVTLAAATVTLSGCVGGDPAPLCSSPFTIGAAMFLGAAFAWIGEAARGWWVRRGATHCGKCGHRLGGLGSGRKCPKCHPTNWRGGNADIGPL